MTNPAPPTAKNTTTDPKSSTTAAEKSEAHITNFVRNRIDAELAQGKYASRQWIGAPGLADQQSKGSIDSAKIRTRFPPEPNGYLHIGHAKSICLNFGLAQDYVGHCHMRFDDTNPVKEDQEYVDSIIDSVHWLGFDWQHGSETNLYYASDYFEQLYLCAVALIKSGDAYVESQTAEQMRAMRGTLTQGGQDSPFRSRSIDENLSLFAQMRAGDFADSSHVLRAKIDMASPNMNMRDPTIYRIRRAHHHRTGDAWCIYPMYDFAHPISDALENITHSVCTLEFADHRPFYDWLLHKLSSAGLLQKPVPEQIEFARLNLTTVITSKRKLQQLVNEGHVAGWDDPRMPTLYGMRRRGYTPESIRLFCERIGVSKSDGWIDYSTLEQALRDDLESRAQRAMAVIDPLLLVIENMPEDTVVECSAPVHPQQLERGTRQFTLGRELWIDQSDFMIEPSKGYHRLFPGNSVRLKYGYVIKCTGYETDASGTVTKVKAEYFPDSRSGTDGANNYKVKSAITWVACRDAVPATLNIYDRLFAIDQPGTSEADFLTELNPNSHQAKQSYVEPSVNNDSATPYFQFERFGYFARDLVYLIGQPVKATGAFNLAVSLKDTKAK
jgi:glutaminyl-tRNA synthetase